MTTAVDAAPGIFNLVVDRRAVATNGHQRRPTRAEAVTVSSSLVAKYVHERHYSAKRQAEVWPAPRRPQTTPGPRLGDSNKRGASPHIGFFARSLQYVPRRILVHM